MKPRMRLPMGVLPGPRSPTLGHVTCTIAHLGARGQVCRTGTRTSTGARL